MKIFSTLSVLAIIPLLSLNFIASAGGDVDEMRKLDIPSSFVLNGVLRTRSSADTRLILNIHAAYAQKDLEEMDRIGTGVEEAIQSKLIDRAESLDVLLYLCQSINALMTSTGVEAARAQHGQLLLEKYAQLALNSDKEVPESAEVKFLSFLSKDLKYSRSKINDDHTEDWQNERADKVQKRLDLWKRLSERVANLESVPALPVYANIAPEVPEGVKEVIVAGMSPSDIKDPGVRANYEEALKENKRRADDNLNRRYWRRLSEEHARNSEAYIREAYFMLPYNMSELQSLMKTFALPEANQKHILDAIQKRMADRPEVAPKAQN